MIGSRSLIPAVGAAVLVTGLLGPGGPGPARELAARRLIAERAMAADSRLGQLQAALNPGLEAARAGAAAVVAGDEEPAPILLAAARELRRAEAVASDTARAMRALDGARLAADAGASRIAYDVSSADVASIADQLAGTAPAADAFMAMRRLAERLPDQLDAALSALERGALGDAAAAVGAARDAHDRLSAWEVDLATMPVWLDTSGAMVDAVERMVAATRAGSANEAADAAADIAALAPRGAEADRALRIALGEGGAAVAAAPLGRLAEMLRRVAEARLAVASILQAVGR